MKGTFYKKYRGVDLYKKGKYNSNYIVQLFPWGIGVILLLGLSLSSFTPTWGDRRTRNLSPDEKERLERQYKKWKSMPPEKQNTLRKRMEQYKGLPPEERQLYQQRFKQWKGLSPEERRGLQEKLEKWNTLPPEEQEGIRRKFRSD